ncbi:MAG: hypothetical protein R2712_06245 [Vicinamibacterales bacterium]
MSGIATLTDRFRDGRQRTHHGARHPEDHSGLAGPEKHASAAAAAINAPVWTTACRIKITTSAGWRNRGPRSAAAAAAPHGLPVEVEAENLEELDEALAAGAPRILLDNFVDLRHPPGRHAVAGRASLEISGGVTLERMPELATTGATSSPSAP